MQRLLDFFINMTRDKVGRCRCGGTVYKALSWQGEYVYCARCKAAKDVQPEAKD